MEAEHIIIWNILGNSNPILPDQTPLLQIGPERASIDPDFAGWLISPSGAEGEISLPPMDPRKKPETLPLVHESRSKYKCSYHCEKHEDDEQAYPDYQTRNEIVSKYRERTFQETIRYQPALVAVGIRSAIGHNLAILWTRT